MCNSKLTVILMSGGMVLSGCNMIFDIDDTRECLSIEECQIGSRCDGDLLIECVVERDGCMIERISDCSGIGDVCADNGTDSFCQRYPIRGVLGAGDPIPSAAGHVVDRVASEQAAHFTGWNFDQSKPNPACMVLNIADPAHDLRSAPVPARVRYRGQSGWTEWQCLDNPNNILYNLPPNKEIEIYMKLDGGSGCSAKDFGPAGSDDFVLHGRFDTGPTWKGRSDPDPAEPQKPADLSACTHVDLWTSAIEGVVELEGRLSNAGAMVIAWNRENGECRVVASARTSSDGSYRLFVPAVDRLPGYEVTIEAPYFLGSSFGKVMVAPGSRRSLPPECLKAGDVNGDDCIDADDTELISTTTLDITEDGCADLCDSNWVIKNYEVNGANTSCCEAPRTGIDSCLYGNGVLPARLGCEAATCGSAPPQCYP